jgi:cytochrome c oxidase subunit 1
MSNITADFRSGNVPVPTAHPPHTLNGHTNYLNANYSWTSWLFTIDHKRIAILYLISVSLMFLLGGFFALMIRINLLHPHGVLQADTYNKMFTMHGVVMIFLFLIPSVPAVLGNFFLPLMIGAKDLAFPRINLLSWYLYIFAAAFVLWSVLQGGVDTGWTFYTPYSSTYSNSYVMSTAVGVLIAGFSSILTGLNFVVTVHKMRSPGQTWFRLPLFIWALYATSLAILLGTPVVTITLMLVAVERTLGVGVFDPRLGGDPIFFQHLFWFYSHPAVYIMILPAMGVINEIIATFTRRPIFGYKAIAFSSIAIALLGFLVWAHHMFVSGLSPYAAIIFSFLTFLVAIPSAIKVFNWTATLYGGSNSFQTPMLYAMGFIGLFTLGGLTGLFLGTLATNIPLHGTYFIVAHFHYIMVGGAIMGYLGGLHYWWPKMTGRMYPEFPAKIAAGIVFIGFNLTFFPQFVLGYMGMPRRYAAYPEEWQMLNVMSTAGASILGVGYLMPLIYLIWSLFYGAKASANPWGSTTLEWQTEGAMPPTENFPIRPIVTVPPYIYVPAAKEVTTSVGS